MLRKVVTLLLFTAMLTVGGIVSAQDDAPANPSLSGLLAQIEGALGDLSDAQSAVVVAQDNQAAAMSAMADADAALTVAQSTVTRITDRIWDLIDLIRAVLPARSATPVTPSEPVEDMPEDDMADDGGGS